MSKKMFDNLQVLRDKCSSAEEFVSLLDSMTENKKPVLVSGPKRRESRAGNTYWETPIDSGYVKVDDDKLWFGKNSYIHMNDLNYFYIRIKDA